MEDAAEVRRDFFELLPEDVVLDILLRLSAKSIAKLRGASKKLGSILRRPDFTERFFTRSCAQRPQLLFVRREEGELFFFSAPQPQDLDENSPPLIADSHMKFAFPSFFENLFAPVAGLVCFRDERYLGKRKTPQLVTSICNPSTGECLLLPKMNTRKRTRPVSFLGYDPVYKLHKVLAMTSSNLGISTEHQVLTLGGELLWRRIECGIQHCPGPKVICIDGVLYYSASVKGLVKDSVIVCFDVRAETFRLIQLSNEFITVVGYSTSFFNYNGRFASFRWTAPGKSFELCVLQDRENLQWLKLVYELPPLGYNRVFLEFWGVIGTNLVVLSPRSGWDPLYVYYYNTNTGTMRRAEIQGIGESMGSYVYSFINHLENVKFMRAIQN